MASSRNMLGLLRTVFSGPKPPRRRPCRVSLTLDGLEDRVVLSHAGGFHHAQHVLGSLTSQTSTSTSGTTTTTVSTSTGGCTSGTSSSNSALSTALQTLQNDARTIQLASGTTVGELTAIRAAFQTLATDGLTPSSQTALSTFENSLVTSFASGTTLTGNATLLSQFEALYSASPTTQQTTDLTTAYNALAAAVTSANITTAHLATIDADQAAVNTAAGGTSTATFPYFSLVTGQAGGGMRGGGHHHH